MLCNKCHAVIEAPDDLAATTMTCRYCDANQVVPDLADRQRAIHQARLADLESKREERLHAKQQHDLNQVRLHAVEKRKEKKTARWGARIGSIISLIGALIVPLVIGVVMFDLPARLGFGDAGEDQLEALIVPFKAKGCVVVSPVSSSYRTSSLSKVVTVEAACIRVLAASGPGISDLKLKLRSVEGKALKSSESGSAPQVRYCSDNVGTVQFEVELSRSNKGRLSTAVLACPSDSASKNSSADKKSDTSEVSEESDDAPTSGKKSKR